MTISTTASRISYNGNGATTAFSFPYRFLTNADLVVIKIAADGTETTLTLNTNYTVTGANEDAGGTVTLSVAPLSGQRVVIYRAVTITQEVDYITGDPFPAETHERALDRLTMVAQQQQDAIDRSAKLPVTSTEDADALIADILRLADSADNIDTLAGIEADITAVADIDSNVTTVAGIAANVITVAGIAANVTSVAGNSSNINAVAGNATNINSVAGNSTNINAVAGNATNINAVNSNSTNINAVNSNSTNINTCATNIAAIIDAPTQAANAASSAAAAAASAASGMYSAVQDKSANYTVVAGDAGDLIRVTTTSGAITITLPAISTVSDGFKVAIVKWTSDANAVNINRSGSDTINGATTAQIGSQYSQIILVADAETSTWFASQSGLGATNVNVDNFSGNGSTTAFTLSSDPSTENNTSVFISGIYQQKNTYSVSGTTLTFSTAPPSGTSNIEVYYATPLAIGTPSDGTVSTAKIVDGNVTAAKMGSDAPNGVSDKSNTSTGYFDLPSGTTAQRPASPANGYARYNTTLNQFEIYQDGAWVQLKANYGLQSMQTFTGSGATGGTYTWTRPAGITKVKVYVVGGGGGAQNVASSQTASGGAGGLSIAVIDVSAISSATVTIGAGGAGASTGVRGGNGGTSSFGSYASATGGEGGVSTIAPYDGGFGGIGTTTVSGAVLGAINSRGGGGQRVGGVNATTSGPSSFFGGGGVGAHDVSTTPAEGQNGSFGGGGGGSQYTAVINGGAGVIVVEEYA
jgi:hypothetical protein